MWATLALMEPGAEPVAEIGPSGRPLSSSLARLTLVGIVLLAAGLRLAGIDFGRPYVYHPDEGFIAQPAMNIVRTGDLDPHLYIYPSGLMYAEAAIIAVLHPLTGASIDTARIQPIERMSSRGPSDLLPEQFDYDVAGRILVALMGTLSVLFVGLVGNRLAGPVAGLAAAGFLAVMPLAAMNAHYLTTDVPTGLAVAVCLWLTVEGTRRGPRWFVAAGVVAGIAASMKYNGGFVLGVPVLTYLFSMGRARTLLSRGTFATLVAIIGGCVIGFVVLTPAVVFRTSAIIEALRFQVEQYSGHAGAEGTDNWRRYLESLFRDQPLIMTLTVVGAGLALVRRRPVEVAIALMTFIYFVIISIPITRYERNLLPILPAFAILAALPVGLAVTNAWRSGLRTRRAAPILLAVFIVVAMIQPGSTVVDQIRVRMLPDTRTIALEWIDANLPKGAAIVREEFTPQVPAPAYRSSWVFELRGRPVADYRRLGVEYLIASSLNFDRYKDRPDGRAYYDEVLAMPIVFEVSPSSELTGPRIVIVRLTS